MHLRMRDFGNTGVTRPGGHHPRRGGGYRILWGALLGFRGIDAVQERLVGFFHLAFQLFHHLHQLAFEDVERANEARRWGARLHDAVLTVVLAPIADDTELREVAPPGSLQA